jgi:integrase
MLDKEKVPRRRGRVESLGGGRYKVTVYVGTGAGGKRLYHRKTLRDSTESKALRHARDIASQAERGDYFAPPKVTLGQLFDDALERWRRDGLRQTTLECRERHIRLHALPALGADTQIGKLTATALQGFYDRLLDGGYKPSSVRLVHATVKACLRRAVRYGLLKTNPADLVELPPRNKPKKAKVFDEDEAVRFVEMAWRERRYVIFIFALLTGMRPSEFFGVEYGDLSLETFGAGGQLVERGLRGRARDVNGWFFNCLLQPGTLRRRMTYQLT